MLKRLMEKVDHMKGPMGNISRNGEKERTKVLEIKNTIIEMMNAFDGLINRLDTTKKRIEEREELPIEISLP